MEPPNEWTTNALAFGLPTVFMASLAFYILLKLHGDLSFPGRFFTLLQIEFLRKYIRKLESHDICFILLFSVVFAPALLLLWWITVALTAYPPLYGVVILCVGVAMSSMVWFLISWSSNGYKWTAATAILFGSACIFIMTFLCASLFVVSETIHTNVSILCMTLSLFPMISSISLLIYSDAWSLSDFGIETSITSLLLQRWPLLVMPDKSSGNSLATSPIRSHIAASATDSSSTSSMSRASPAHTTASPAASGDSSSEAMVLSSSSSAVYVGAQGPSVSGEVIPTPTSPTSVVATSTADDTAMVTIDVTSDDENPSTEHTTSENTVISDCASTAPASPLPLAILGLREPRTLPKFLLPLVLFLSSWVTLWMQPVIVNARLHISGSASSYVTVDGVLLVDMMVVFAVFAGRINSLVVSTSILTCARIIFVLFGNEYSFLGQALVYLLLSTWLAVAIAARYSPSLDSSDLHAQLLAADNIEKFRLSCAAAEALREQSGIADQTAAGQASDADNNSDSTGSLHNESASDVAPPVIAAPAVVDSVSLQYREWLEDAIESHPPTAQTRLNRLITFVRAHSDASLWMLSAVVFLERILVAHSKDLPPLQLERAHQQWVIMLATLAVSVVVLGTASLKVYVAHVSAFSMPGVVAAGVWVSFVTAIGVVLFVFMESFVVLEVFCTAPLTFLISYGAYLYGIVNGLQPLQPPAKLTQSTQNTTPNTPSNVVDAIETPTAPSMHEHAEITHVSDSGGHDEPTETNVSIPGSVPSAAIPNETAATHEARGKTAQEIALDFFKYCGDSAAAVYAQYPVFTIAMCLHLGVPLIAGGVFSLFVRKTWQAWLPTVLFIACPAAVIAILWAVHYNTVSAPVQAAGCLAVMPVALGLLLFYILPHSDAEALWPLVMAVVWFVACCVFAACVLISRALGKVTLPAGFLLAAAVVLLFFIILVLAILFTPWTFNVALAIGFVFSSMMAIFLGFIWPRIQSRFPNTRPLHVFAPVAGLTLLYTIFLGIAFSHGFLGFSLSWLLLLTFIVLIIIGQHTDTSFFIGSQETALGTVFTEFVFPAVSLDDSTTPATTKFTNLRVGLPLFALGMLFLWGAAAIVFLSTAILGLSACCLALVCIFTLITNCRLSSRHQFSQSLRILALRCPAKLPALLAEAQTQALKHQLNINPDAAAGNSAISEDGAVGNPDVLRKLGVWSDIPAVSRAAWRRVLAERAVTMGEHMRSLIRWVITGTEPLSFEQPIAMPSELSVVDVEAVLTLRSLVYDALSTPILGNATDNAAQRRDEDGDSEFTSATADDVEVTLPETTEVGVNNTDQAVISIPEDPFAHMQEVFEVLSCKLSRETCYAVLHHLDAHLDALHLLSAALAAEVSVAVVRLATQVEAARCQTLQNVLRRAAPALSDVRADEILHMEKNNPLIACRLASLLHKYHRQGAVTQRYAPAAATAQEEAQKARFGEVIARQNAEMEARTAHLWTMIGQRTYEKDIFISTFEDAVLTATNAIESAARTGNAREQAYWSEELVRIQAAEDHRIAEERTACALCTGRYECTQKVSGCGVEARPVLQDVFGCQDCGVLLCGVCVHGHKGHVIAGPVVASVACEAGTGRESLEEGVRVSQAVRASLEGFKYDHVSE